MTMNGVMALDTAQMVSAWGELLPTGSLWLPLSSVTRIETRLAPHTEHSSWEASHTHASFSE